MDKNSFITNNPIQYFEVQNQSLQQRLDKIELSKKESKEIVVEKTIKTIVDKTLGAFPMGDLISTLLNWTDEVDQEITAAKQAVLMEQYFNKTDRHESSINNLKHFLTHPQGNVLFNKILRILDDYPPDHKLIEHLSSTLKYMVDKENFSQLFEQHKFALSQIEKLTPQALTVLSDYISYPPFELGGYTSMGAKISSDWNTDFVRTYCLGKNITEPGTVNRVAHSITELQTQGFIEAYKTNTNGIVCEVTNVGKDILPYLLA